MSNPTMPKSTENCWKCKKRIPDDVPPQDRTFVFGKRNRVLGEVCTSCAAKRAKKTARVS